MVLVGAGTQRLEEALARLYPEVPQLRLDSDSMGGAAFFRLSATPLSRASIAFSSARRLSPRGMIFPIFRLSVFSTPTPG